jgi:hypothetical protein
VRRNPGSVSRAAVLALSVLAVAACDETGTDVDAAAEIAEAKLFDAMNRDDYGAAGDIVGELWELRYEDPQNHRNGFILASAALWWIAEAGQPNPVINPLQIIAQSIPIILENFTDVILNDSENRPGASALLGAFLAETGFDRVQGSALVDSAAVWVPEVGLFQQMHIRRFAAADDTLTVNAIEAGFKFWEVCAGGPIDRANPDFTAYMEPPTSEDFAKFCWGSARVPHGFEGSWMIFGDLLVKGGHLDAARRAYLNARLSPNYDRWKYKDHLEQRLTADLSQRQATYLNRDPTQWAPIGVPIFSCTQCHASAR